LLAPGTESFSSLGDRTQRSFQRSVEHLVAVFAETARLHAPAKQIKAEIEVSRVTGIVVEESHRRRPQSVRWRFSTSRSICHSLSESGKRILENFRVYGFLRLKVEIERSWRVTGRGRNCP